MSRQPRLGIVVPVYNEERTVAQLVEAALAIPVEKEVIVVDDGSTDATAAELAAFASRPEVRLLSLDFNQGKGRAIRAALPLVTAPVIVIQDADLEYDPAELPRLLEPIESGRARVVYGSRRLEPQPWHSGPLYLAGGLLVTWLTQLLFRLPITDAATGYKMLETDLLRSLELRCERFEFCPEVNAKLAKRGIPILELPITYRARKRAEGKKIGLRDFFEAVSTLIVERVRS